MFEELLRWWFMGAIGILYIVVRKSWPFFGHFHFHFQNACYGSARVRRWVIVHFTALLTTAGEQVDVARMGKERVTSYDKRPQSYEHQH
jgi:hypothetical protein